MAITLTDGVATFEGSCAIEEAEPLLEWLKRTPSPRVDLARCEHLHTAVLQTLLAAAPALATPPADPLLARLLARLPGAAPSGVGDRQ